jgi:hypothetical protein
MDQVEREGYCLLKLCKELEAFIRIGQSRKTYLLETTDFLHYLCESITAIVQFARDVINEKTSPELRNIRLKDFGEIQTALDSLYVVTKQAIDADSLAIPFSLVTYLNDRVRKLGCTKKAKLVVLCGSDLMYYKWNLKPFRDLTTRLRSRIPGYPVFPKDIGVLEFPYFAAKDVLLNCIFFHETGHYVYENTDLELRIHTRVVTDFVEYATTQNLLSELKEPLIEWRSLLNYVRNLIARWTDELFADIFAVRVLGAAFHLACRELEHVLSSVTEQRQFFCDTHPAPDFRFRFHAKWLRIGRWLDVLQKRTPEVHNKLIQCEQLDVHRDFVINSKPPIDDEKGKLTDSIHKWILNEFESLVGTIEEEVSNLLKGYEEPIDDFEKCDGSVTRLLSHGVVPSTVFDSERQASHPLPTTVLNSGFFFYLSGVDVLLERIEGDDDPIDKRVNTLRRLNEWLGKAIDDWQFIQKVNA